MGIFEEYGAHVSEDKRDAFKAAVSALDGAVKIDSRESVEKLADNPFMKSYLDSQISRAVESHDAKFKAEKLPGMIDEEIRKREPPPENPAVARALEEAKKANDELAKMRAENFRISQYAKVVPKLTELGLDAELADRLIGNSDAETDAIIEKFTSAIVKARDEYTAKYSREHFGSQSMPPAGGSPATSKEAMVKAYQDAINAGKREEANRIYVAMQKMR